MMVLNNPVLHAATVHSLPDGTIRIVIPTPTIQWKAGQHVFLRFRATHGRIAPIHHCQRVPRHKQPAEGHGVRAPPARRFTRALAQSSRTEFKVLVDGPYGHAADELASFDSVLLCVGGSGLSWALAAAQAVLAREAACAQARLGGEEYAALQWFRDELGAIGRDADVEIYITGEVASPVAVGKEKASDEDEDEESEAALAATHHGARPLPHHRTAPCRRGRQRRCRRLWPGWPHCGLCQRCWARTG
jgi:NAD(P)H-flavin reductase